MKLHNILGIGVRIFGILVLVVTIRDLPLSIIPLKQMAMDSMSGESDYTYYYFFLLFSCVLLITSLVMIKFPSTVAKLLVPNYPPETEINTIEADAVYFGGIFLIAIYILSWAIPDLVHNLLFIIQAKSTYASDSGIFDLTETFYGQYPINLVVSLIEIIIALYFLFGAKNIVNFCKKFRG